MYVSVAYGDVGFLHAINTALAEWTAFEWVIALLILPCRLNAAGVADAAQRRDYINSLSSGALALVVVGGRR
ncbi:MAG: hypothetical protein R3F11_31240 [Verrucomicrobiales bacterium]